jgi:hypothetical protein
MLTDADIDAILGDKPTKQRGNIWTPGKGWEGGKITATTVGAYEGKTGTKYRSRKGRTWTRPNGRRYYNNLTESVVAYRAPGV